MAEYNENTLVAPVYRYYTTDLLTNKILAEIPFAGVSYERALKSAGAFSGKIPVLPTPSSRSWDLYKSTLPGKTGLYIMRDDQCVWGGIIWSRTYDLVDRTLSVDASEFTSYFHHRIIWKTWSHVFGATVVSSNGTATVQFTNGSSVDLVGGASVRLDFFAADAPLAYLSYAGYYTIAENPAPTDSSFTIAGSVSTADLLSVERTNGVATVYTKGAHGFSTGDVVTINVIIGTQVLDGTYAIVATSGAASSTFTFNSTGVDLPNRTVTGVATRPLPDGTYNDVTISIRTDTYGYIRSLIEAVFDDFNGIDFVNSAVAPATSQKLTVVNKTATAGYATITTNVDHGLIPGQSVDIFNVGKQFDGSPVVLDTPHTNTFRFMTGGEIPTTTLAIKSVPITARALAKGVATMTTQSAHNFSIGDTVTVYAGGNVDGNVDSFNGDQIITQIDSPTTFKYNTIFGTDTNYDTVQLTQPTATVGGTSKVIVQTGLASNTIAVQTDSPHNFAVGNSVTIQGIDVVIGINDKSYDYVTNTATVTTQDVHNFDIGDSILLSGIADISAITAKTIPATGNTITLTTKVAHNFKKGDTVTISDVRDGYVASNRYINSSNQIQLTLSHDTNVNVGDTIKVADIYEQNYVVSGSIAGNVGKLTLSDDLMLYANDRITVSGIKEQNKVTTKSLDKGTVTLTTSKPHNFVVGQKVVINNCAQPFDGTYKITDVTDTKIKYKIDSKSSIKSTADKDGTVTGDSSVLNGTHTISTISGSTIKFPVVGNNVTSLQNVGSSGPAIARYLSPINTNLGNVVGTTSTTVTYTIPGISVPARASKAIVPSSKKDDPKPRISATSIFNATNVKITAVSRNTFSYTTSKTIRYRYTNQATTAGSVASSSIFNGTRTVTAVTEYTFQFKLPTALDYNIKETPINTPSYARAKGIFNGTYTITSIDATRSIFGAARGGSHVDIKTFATSAYGLATVAPTVVNSTYGPYPGNSDLKFLFSTQDYSGNNVTPVEYSGYELKNVGEALDTYADSVDGFEYRIDCDYDPDLDSFKRTFVLLPIDFPNPPATGQVSPPSRFGADQIVFEYPGNITTFSIAESAENSSTRFFATGDSQGSDGAGGSQISVSSADDLLGAPDGDRWPLLDDSQKIDNIIDENVLSTYADRYLIEGRPPGVDLSVSVNGSLSPQVGFYNPGDWCSLIVDDEFVLQRLKSDLEPRDDILVRKIQGFKVSVPDGSTVPEKVDLTLVRETGVDSVGQ